MKLEQNNIKSSLQRTLFKTVDFACTVAHTACAIQNIIYSSCHPSLPVLNILTEHAFQILIIIIIIIIVIIIITLF